MLESRSLCCPDCGEPLVDDGPCPTCGRPVAVRHGIPSFFDGRSSPETRRIADVIESGSDEDLLDYLESRDRYNHLVDEIFGGLRDDWRMLLTDSIHGECLDLWAGYGTRSLMLADHADTVYAVNDSLDELRVLAACEHNLRPKVQPVHTTVEALPFQAGRFDAIVVDPPLDVYPVLPRFVSKVRRYLHPDGALILKLDGPFGGSGILPIGLGSERHDPSTPRSILDVFRYARLGRYRKLLTERFDSVQFYALFPTKGKSRYVFRMGDERAARYLFDDKISRNFDELGEVVGKTLSSALPLNRVLPKDYLVVASDRQPNEIDVFAELLDSTYDGRLLFRGQRRAILLYLDEDGVAYVQKLPKNTRTRLHDDRAVDNENEYRTLEALREAGGSITATISQGTLSQTPFGPVLTERAAAGELVLKRIKRTPDRYRENLRYGLEWAAQFQLAFRGETVVRNSEDVRTDLSAPDHGVEPPGAVEPIRLFETPAKNDHSPENLFVDPQAGKVTTAIDWEGGTRHENPFLDPCMYALTLATRTFDGFERGVQQAFVADTEYAAITRNVIEEYVDAVGLDVDGFVTYLPYPFIRSIRARGDGRSGIIIGTANVIDRIEYLWDNEVAIRSRMRGR